MDFLHFDIGNNDVDRRLDRVIRKFLKTTSLSIIYKNIRSGFIRINNVKVKSDYRLKVGDILFVEKNLYEKCEQTNLQESVNTMSSNNVALDVIFRNEHIVVINKASGINVQASTKNEVSLDKIIQDEYVTRLKEGVHESSLSFLPGPLHRLDKYTTGVLCFSQSLLGARSFSETLVSHNIAKHYLAIVTGRINDHCIWEHAILKNESSTNNFSTVCVQDIDSASDLAKKAKTVVHPIGYGNYKGEEITLAHILIETGRTHQIRSQAAFSNHVLFGDTAYGYAGNSNTFFLHAWAVEYPKNNAIGLPEKLIAEIPNSFKNFIHNHLQNVRIPSYNDIDETTK